MKICSIILFGLILIPQSSALGDPWKSNLGIQRPAEHDDLIAGWKPLENKKGSRSQASTQTMIALKKFKQMPELESYFQKAEGYAVFPTIGKAGFGVGAARGQGEVFQNENVIGSTTVTQLSIGFQLGGQAFSQIIFFKQKKDLNRFIAGNFEFGASASAALINTGAATEAAYSNGVAVLTISKGGLMYEASIGGQKFNFESYE
tara:strand:+ start:1533 stop:2144 length:612 start_codon:yes stop_codon:yes gene_type:complete